MTSKEIKAWDLLCETLSQNVASIQYDFWNEVPPDLQEKYLRLVDSNNSNDSSNSSNSIISTCIGAESKDKHKLELNIQAYVPIEQAQDYVDSYTSKHFLSEYEYKVVYYETRKTDASTK